MSGESYKIHLPREGMIQSSIIPISFRDESSARQFINSISVTHEYWKEIIHQCGNISQSQFCGPADIEKEISHLMIRDQLRFYPVKILDAFEHPPEKRVLKSTDNTQYRFEPGSTLLVNNVAEVKYFENSDRTKDFITSLSASNEDLSTIAKELNVSVPNTAKVNPSETIDAIANEIASGNVVIIVDKTSSAPPSKQEETTDSNTNNQDAGLGPHNGNETPVCDVSELNIKCSHASRNYQLDAINSPNNFNGSEKVIQVLAKPGDPDKMTIDFAGSCVNGNDQCPSIKVYGDNINDTFNSSPVTFDALPKVNDKKPDNFIDFLKYYLIPDLDGLDYQTYIIKNKGCSSCNDRHEAKIHAFPTFKWGGSISFGYTEKDKDNAALKLAANINGNVGEKNWAFETSSSEQIDKYFPELHEKVDNIVKRLSEFKTMSNPDAKTEQDKEIGLIKFNVDWPSISLGGNIELKEASGNHEIDVGGDINFGFNPLLKADVRTDILDWFITGVGGPFGEFLRRVKIKAAKGVGTKTINAKAIVALEVVVSGGLSATLKWEKNAKEKWLSKKGDKTSETSASLNIGLEGKIQGETKIFRVKIVMGAELHLKGANSVGEGIGGTLTLFATTADNKPALGGSFKFTGAALYYTYYAEIGSAQIENNDTQETTRRRGSSGARASAANDVQKNTKLKEDRLKKLHQFFDPQEWPKNDKGNTPVTGINL